MCHLLYVECVDQREPELEFGAIYRAKIVEIRQVSSRWIFRKIILATLLATGN